MINTQIFKEITNIKNQHRFDKDGGVTLSKELVCLFHSLSDNRKIKYLELMLFFVKTKNEEWYDYSLDVLVDCQCELAGLRLYELIKDDIDPTRPDYWHYRVYFSLNRLQYKEAASDCLLFLERSLKEEFTYAYSVLSIFFLIDIDNYITLTSRFLVEYTKKETSNVDTIWQLFFSQIAKYNIDILRELLDNIRECNHCVLIRILEVAKSNLKKPWILNKLSVEQLNQVNEIIRSAYK